MKAKITKIQVINIILFAAFILIDILYVVNIYTSSPFFRRQSDPRINYGWYNNLKPIDTPISRDLPYYKFKELKENRQMVRDLKNGDFNTRRAFFGIIGTDMGYICDTCTTTRMRITPSNIEYYITLPGWKLNSTSLPFPSLDSVIFHIEHGQSYIRKGIIGPQINNSDGSIGYQVHIRDIPVKFRYSRKFQMLKIPVSKTLTKVVNCVVTVLSVLLVIYTLYMIIIFLRFIIDLSKGFAFTYKNIFRLRLLAYSLIGAPVVSLLSNLLFRFIFNSYFTPDVVLNINSIRQSWIIMHAGFVFLLLFNAFRQGKALKDEQDLTV